MRHLALLALTLLSALASGCSPQGYFTDRWRDAKDIFTASVGVGGGAKARVGPLNTGLFADCDITGLRGGEGFYCPTGEPMQHVDCVLLLMYGGDGFNPGDPPEMLKRNKEYTCIFTPPTRLELPRTPYYYTQIEVAAGIGGTVRLGFNPGEFVDFILGWFGLDIFDDDLEAKAAKFYEPGDVPRRPGEESGK